MPFLNKTIKKCLASTTFFLFALHVHAICLGRSSPDTMFIHSRLSEYNNWLHFAGLDRYLYAVDYGKIKEHQVRLGIKSQDKDSIEGIWRSCKDQFEKVNKVRIEEVLLEKASFYFESPPDSTSLYLSDTYQPTNIPCFILNIWHDHQLKSDYSFCQSASAEVNVKVVPKKIIAPDAKITTQHLMTMSDIEDIRSTLIDSFRSYFLSRYKGTEFRILESEDSILSFYVINLKNEVIKPVSMGVNPYEYLKCYLKLTPKASSVYLKLVIDGKYGNGIWKPLTVGAYADFTQKLSAELDNYTKALMAERITIWVKKSIRK